MKNKFRYLRNYCKQNLILNLIICTLFIIMSCDNNNTSPEPEEQLSLIFGVVNGGDAVVGCTLEVICPPYINNKVVTTRWFKDGVRNYFLDGQRYYSPTSTGNFYVTVSAQGFESKTSDVIIVGENDWTLLLKGTKWRKIDNENVWIEFEDVSESPRMYWNYAAQSVYFVENIGTAWGNHWGNKITTKSHITFNAIVANDILTISNWSGSFYGEDKMNGNYYKK